MPIFAAVPQPTWFAVTLRVQAVPTALKAAQAAKGLTLAQLAKAVGVSQPTLRNVLGGSKPSYDTLVACLTWLAAND